MRRIEVIACGLGLALLTLLICTAHVRHGGFYYGDRSVVAIGRFPGPSGLLHDLWPYCGQRPGQVLYYAALDEVFGLHASLLGVILALRALKQVGSPCARSPRRLALAVCRGDPSPEPAGR